MLLILMWFYQPHFAVSADFLTLENAVEIAIQNNPEISAATARVDAEHAMAISVGWPKSPMAGWMKEEKLNYMEVDRGPMNFWVVSQEVEFPLTLVYKSAAQRGRAYASEQELVSTKWNVRHQVVTAYYNYYTRQKTLALLNAQKEILRDMSRIVEARRATGQAPQQDEMKVHVEQTMLENEILLAKQESDVALAQLNAAMNRDADANVTLPEGELKTPKTNGNIEDLKNTPLLETPEIMKAKFLSEEANFNRKRAKWELGPSTFFSFRKPYTNDEPGAYGVNLEISIPLWFLMKEIPEITAATSLAIEADSKLTRTLRSTQVDFVTLSSKVRTTENLLTIYETALIPQTDTTFKSSRAAYQGGQVNFIELLDSERSYYATRITFYQLLTQYVENLSKLEQLLGKSISTIPVGGLS